MTEIKIRVAFKNEIEWINSKYLEIKFVPSKFENELIAIAEIGNLKCGLGRIVNIDNKNCELGGIFVFEEYRGMKTAEKIVAFLIDKNKHSFKRVWCLPFERLKPFYIKFGFEQIETKNINIPKVVIEKHKWCNSNYLEEVLLLVK